ncbi:MAG: glycosyltransferase family 39 protein [Acidobacteriota bacterium]
MTQYLAPFAASAVFAIEHILALLLIVIIAFAIGRRLTARVAYHNPLEAACFSTSLGLGFISFLILFLGLFHLLYPSTLAITLAIALLACHPVLATCLRNIRGLNPQRLWSRPLLGLAVIVILIVTIPFFVLSLYPPSDWDATQYHLAAPKIYVREHAVVFTPYLRYPVFPQTNQMLFTGALLLYDDPVAQQIQLLMLLTLAGALVSFGCRYFSLRAGWWAAALLLASPLVVLLGTIAYVDVGLALFVFLAVYAFWNWRETRSNFWLVLSGVFCGLAFSSKFTGAFFPLVFCLSLVWTGWKERRFRLPFILGGVALAVASPWIVRGIYYAGNPLFPFLEDFFTGIFGQRQVDPIGFRDQVASSLGVGTGRSTLALLKVPWNLAFHQEVFLPEARLSVVSFLLLPLTAVCAVFDVKIRRILLLALSYTVFWFFGYQFVRYLVPALPLFCLAAAASVDWLLGRLSKRPAWLNSPVLTGVICVILILPAWYYAARRVRWEGFVPTTSAERDRYLTTRIPSYPAYQFLNSLMGEAYRLYALDDVKMAYHADGTFMGDWYGEARYGRILAKMNSSEALFDELKLLRADYLLLNSAVEKAKLPEDEFFRRNFRLVFAVNQTRVFELSKEKVYQ